MLCLRKLPTTWPAVHTVCMWISSQTCQRGIVCPNRSTFSDRDASGCVRRRLAA